MNDMNQMSETVIKRSLLSVVEYPIFRIDDSGTILEYHVHKEFDAINLRGNLLGINISQFDYLPNGVDVIKYCLLQKKAETTYFSIPNSKGSNNYFEVDINPSGPNEVIAVVKEVTNRRRIESELIHYYNLIQNIYQGTASSTGYRFLDHLAMQLCKSFDADFSFIAGFEKNEIQTISLATCNDILENETGSIEGSPFMNMGVNDITSVPLDCKILYPTFSMFNDRGIEGFVALPLLSEESPDRPVGVVCVMFRRRYNPFRHYDKILKIFSTRAMTELERIKHLGQIEASEKKFKALYHNTPALFNSLDAEGRITEAGEFFLEKTGYSREELIGRKAMDLVTPASRTFGLNTVFPMYKKKGYCHDVPLQFVKKNGDIMDVLFSSVVVRDAQGNFQKSLTSLQDVTEINKRRKEIIESESYLTEEAQRLQFLFDHSPVGIIIHSDGIIKKVNAEAIRLTKAKSASQLLGKSPMDFIHPDSREVAQKRINNIYTKRTAHKNEQKFMCFDGSVIWLEAMGTLIYYEGEPAVQIAIYDITDRKEAQTRVLENEKKLKLLNDHLTRQNHQLEEFAHIASHNLRAPITNMMSLIKIKESDIDKSTEQFVWENLKKGVDNLDETIVELNEVVKTSWELDKRKRKIKLSSVLNKISASIKNELIESGGTIQSNFVAFDSIIFPKVYLESILINLITNSLKYADPKRPAVITISTRLEPSGKILEVEDNGQGIDIAKYGKRIFGLRKTFHNHPEARGVGLFITKAQVESMGGTIRVESEIGKGSKFIINFGEA